MSRKIVNKHDKSVRVMYLDAIFQDAESLHLYPSQVSDPDLYRQSLQLLRADRPLTVTSATSGHKPEPQAIATQT